MGLYAIGDLHLHFGSELKAWNQLHDRVWRGHEKKFIKNCRKTVHENDTLVLIGDHSWGRNMDECAPDFEYIKSLPGKKVLIRGNHDMFWDAKKTESLNQMFRDELFFLQDNFYPYKDYAIVGTKGFTFEGPFFIDRYTGQVTGWDEKAKEHADRLVVREAVRLRKSFDAAQAAGYDKFIMFLHYPPTSIIERESIFTDIAREYGASRVIYAHCHGQDRFGDSLTGIHDGIPYSLASGDYLWWKAMKVMD